MHIIITGRPGASGREAGGLAPYREIAPPLGGRLHGQACYLSFLCIFCWNGLFDTNLNNHEAN